MVFPWGKATDIGKPELSWKWFLKTEYEEQKGTLSIMKYIALVVFCVNILTMYYFTRDIVATLIVTSIGTALIMAIFYIVTIIFCAILARSYRRITGEELKI